MAGSFANLITHVVFSTKHRENLIPESFEADLYAYLAGVIRGERGVPIAMGGTANHVHLLAVFSPAISVSEMAKRIKGNSSRWINAERRLPGHFAWQGGYGAFSVSESAKDRVVQYIRNQKEHHRRQTFEEEFIGLLEKHHVPWDEKYIWA
ncbi:MAG: IS200/IS605 family transposase [Verrucomicrobiae bacterium]|nr:IS200/IS605 family transposase [Verrucomicrobiae bacterium]